MKKNLLVILLLSSMSIQMTFAQTLGESAVKELLTKKFNKQLPNILGKGKILDGLNVTTLKIRPGHIKIKGQTKWKVKLGKHNQSIRFKGIISTRFNSFGKPDLLVNFPGDRFLFFRKYQKLSELINLEKVLSKTK